MEDHALLKALANWPGRVATQLAFEARGFLVHRAWQNRMIEFCGEDHADLLNRYWDEVALETMGCAGKVISDQRIFVGEAKYRSAFLDELFAAKDFVDPVLRYPPLFRGLFEHLKKTWFDKEFHKSERAFMEEQTKQEIERLGIQSREWTEKKRDVLPFIDEFGSVQGFKRNRNRWHKNLDCGLVFEISTLGGSPYVTQMPLKYRVFHENDPEFAFETGGGEPFDRLVYGSRIYNGGRGSRDFVLAVRANIELFDVIATSFDTSQQA